MRLHPDLPKQRRRIQQTATKAAAAATQVAGSGTATRLIEPASYCSAQPEGRFATRIELRRRRAAQNVVTGNSGNHAAEADAVFVTTGSTLPTPERFAKSPDVGTRLTPSSVWLSHEVAALKWLVVLRQVKVSAFALEPRQQSTTAITITIPDRP